MWLPLLGLIVGILFGSIFTFAVPVVYAKYLSVAVLAGLDSLVGGYRAVLEDKFDGPILLSGFFTNALFAAGLAYLGDLLGLDLYLAAVIAFGLRLFSNISFIRRNLIANYRKKKAAQQEAVLAAAVEVAALNALLEETPTVAASETVKQIDKEIAPAKNEIIEQSILASANGLGDATRLKKDRRLPGSKKKEPK